MKTLIEIFKVMEDNYSSKRADIVITNDKVDEVVELICRIASPGDLTMVTITPIPEPSPEDFPTED